jgi:hypothetical protein
LRNSSFAFQVFDDDFTYDGGSLPVRHLISVRLIDVSPVSTPAYPDATVGLRSRAAHYDIDPEHVFTMARENRLLDLFVRTDNRGPVKPATPLSVAQRRKQLTDMRYPPQRVTMAQRRAELTRMRYSPEPISGRSALLELLAMKED